MSAFKRAIEAGYRAQQAVAGEDITIRRGELETTGVPALRGRTVFEHTADDEIAFTERVNDFLIEPAKYRLDGKKEKPRDGDQIEDGEGNVYEVSRFPPEPAWRWSDAHKLRLRIHTRKV